MGSLRLRSSRAVWCAQTRRHARHGHRERGDGGLDDGRELARAWGRGFFWGGQRNAGGRARAACLVDATGFSARESEGGHEARGEGRCQDPFSVRPIFRASSSFPSLRVYSVSVQERTHCISGS